jgi:hypothetical protein
MLDVLWERLVPHIPVGGRNTTGWASQQLSMSIDARNDSGPDRHNPARSQLNRLLPRAYVPVASRFAATSRV